MDRTEIMNSLKLRTIILIAFKRHLAHWPLYISLAASVLIVFMFRTHVNSMFVFLKDNSMNIFSISISSVAIILTALGLILTIYPKYFLKFLLEEDSSNGINTFLGFVSPYVFGGILWTINALLYLAINMIDISRDVFVLISFFVLFFSLIYSILFIIYVFAEIIQHFVLSIFINESNGE